MSCRRLICRAIADGTTSELYAGSITVDSGKITRIERGNFAVESSDDVFFGEEVIVAPALIDAHGHSDISLMAMPEAQGKTSQGIGWEISGNCGLSTFPLTKHNRAHLQELYAQYRIKLDWSDFESYQNKLNRCRPAMGLLPLVGHNTLRAAVAGYEKKHLSGHEMSQMLTLLDQELSAGALGISFGLLYVPGCFAEFEEIKALMQIAARHNKIAAVHLRSEGNALYPAIEEMLSAARAAGLKKLHLSHLKTVGLANFDKLSIIENALNTSDISVTGDVYCYDASMTQLSVVITAPFDKYDDVTLQKMLHDKSVYDQLLKELPFSRPAEYWERVRLLSLPEPYQHLSGMLLTEAAGKASMTWPELYLDILKSNAPMATAAFHTLSRENMEKLATHPHTVPGSDESARNVTTAFGSSHPRGFGNHAEYFALRRRQGVDIAMIIAEMTGRTAEIFGLQDIGRIAPGCRARLAIINPEKYASKATYKNPHTIAVGAQVLDF